MENNENHLKSLEGTDAQNQHHINTLNQYAYGLRIDYKKLLIPVHTSGGLKLPACISCAGSIEFKQIPGNSFRYCMKAPGICLDFLNN